MTITERVDEILKKNIDMDVDSFEKLVLMAYYIGLERGATEVLDKHNKLAEKQRETAEKCRYHKMAQNIVGDTFIYDTNFRKDMTKTFGGDQTEF